jgi:hypothetical protein
MFTQLAIIIFTCHVSLSASSASSAVGKTKSHNSTVNIEQQKKAHTTDVSRDMSLNHKKDLKAVNINQTS